jgi:hypothetical protein
MIYSGIMCSSDLKISNSNSNTLSDLESSHISGEKTKYMYKLSSLSSSDLTTTVTTTPIVIDSSIYIQ